MSGLRPVDEVKAQLLGLVTPTTKTETRSLDEALGCCLAADIVSSVDVPPADNSAMDGYALAVSDASLDALLPVSARIPAGAAVSALAPGTCARIFTGAEMPPGANAVVMQENTELVGEEVRLLQLPEPRENVRDRGQDIQSGSKIASRGDVLNPRLLSLVASVGGAEVTVFTPLTVAIMSTGDELVEPGGTLSPGQIFNSNRYALAGMLRQLGFNVLDLGIIPDSPVATREALARAAQEADCIFSSGGVSVGEEDHVKDAVESLGELSVWKLAIKPGKPLAFGRVSGVPFFGLPGNPVSTFVTFTVIARACLLAQQGVTDVNPRFMTARAGFDFEAGSREEYLRVRLYEQDGEPFVRKFGNQGSGVMTSVVWADALAKVEAGRKVVEGDRLVLVPVREM